MTQENKPAAGRTRIALITGGSRGLGRNMAIAIAKKGIDTVITYNTNRTAATEVVNEISSMGRKAVAFQLNTSDARSFEVFVKDFSAWLQENTGNASFDFLVNNAGTALYSLIKEVKEEQVDQIFNIHFKAVVLLTQQLLPFINEGGGIINISSGLTRITNPGSAVYASMKAAVETFTRYLAKETGDRKIRANVVAPGAIETDFGNGRVRDNPDINKHIAGITALGRVGLPDDIGGVVAFLCTEEAYWINGQRIEVSGGQAL